MAIARPRKHPTRNARQAAYQSRLNEKHAKQAKLAAIALETHQIAAARGLVPLLESDEIEAAQRLLEFVRRVEVGGDAKVTV